MNFRKFLPKRVSYFKDAFLNNVLGAMYGALLLFYPIGTIIGIILFMIDSMWDGKVAETMDTREDIQKTKIEIDKTKTEIKKILQEAEKVRKEIHDIRDKTFDTFSKRGFLTIEERLKELEKEVGLERSYGGKMQTIEKTLKELKDDISKINGKHYW